MASKEELQIIISAKDRASGVFGKIGGGLRALGTVGVVGTAAAVGGVAVLGVKLLSLGSDAEEAAAKFDTVFGATAQRTRDQLNEFASTVGRNRFELQEYAATLQDTFVPLGFARDEAAGMSVELVKLATDLASFNNVSEEDVVRDLQSALVGNTETLRKYGVVATQAAIEQEALNSGLIGSKGELDALTKAQAILNLTLASTTDAQGDATTTAGSWANQMRAAKSALTETATAIGQELLPVFAPLLQDFTTWLRDIMPQLIPIMQDFASNLATTLPEAISTVSEALKIISEALGLSGEDATEAEAAMALLGATLNASVDGITLVAGAIHKVAEAVQILVGLIDQVKTIIDLLGQVSVLQGAQAVNEGIASVNPLTGLFEGVFGNSNTGAQPPMTINMDGERVGSIVGGHQGTAARQQSQVIPAVF